MKRLLVGALLLALVGCGDEYEARRQQVLAEDAADAAATAVRCDRAWADMIFGQARHYGLVEYSEVTPEGVILVVDRRVFEDTSYSDLTKIAVAVDCAVAGDGKHVNAVRFRTGLHSDDLQGFEAADLVRARAQQFPPGVGASPDA